MKVKLSVVIPTYNRASILKKCLEHLAAQKGVEFEVIVVDDGSTDCTKEVVSEFGDVQSVSVITNDGAHKIEKNDASSESFIHLLKMGKPLKKNTPKAKNNKKAFWSRLKYIKQNNTHQGAARNRGIKEARGDIIVFVDDDIFVQPGFLKYHADRHADHPNESIAVLGLTTWDPELPINDYMRFLESSGWQFGYPFLNPGMIGKLQPYKFFYTSNLSLKKSFLKKEPFNETFKGYGFEDMELGYRLWKNHDMKIYYEPKAFAYHHNLIPESELPQKMRSIGKSAVHFQKLHPEIWALPRGFKKWLIKSLTNPVTLPLTRLLGKNSNFKFRSWREFWVGVKDLDE